MPKTKEKVVKNENKSGKKISREELEVAAYYRWLNRGCPSNDDLSDWVNAEKDWSTSHDKN